MDLKSEVFAEIGAPRLRIVDEIAGRAGKEHFSFLDQVGAGGDRKDLAGIVVGDKDADLFFFENTDEVFDISDGKGVDVGKGLVEEEKRGLGDKGAGDLKTAPFASREAGCNFFAEMLEMELFEESIELGLPVGDREGFKNAKDVVFDSEGTEDRGFLGEVAEAELGPFVDRERGDILPFEVDLPFVGLDKTDGHVESGCFSSPVGAQETDYFSRLDVERKSVYDGLVIEPFHKVFYFK
jgi:hypothetical protein